MRSTESVIISSYPTIVSGIIVLSSTKNWVKIFSILLSTGSSFGPFWGKIFRDKNLDQDVGVIPWVESQSDYQKFNIQSLILNKCHLDWSFSLWNNWALVLEIRNELWYLLITLVVTGSPIQGAFVWLFRKRNSWKILESPFDWIGIPIPENLECLPSFLLRGAEKWEKSRKWCYARAFF